MRESIRKAWRALVDVVLDRSAGRKPSASAAEAAAAVMAALAAVIGAANLIGDTLTKLLGEAAAAWIPPLVLVMLLVLSLYIVIARQRKQSAAGMIDAGPKDSFVYTFAQPLRQTAKVASILLLIAAPASLASTIIARTPLPDTFDGSIVDQQHNLAGVANAMVRVIDKDGTDLTKGTWYTDDQGSYHVAAKRRVPRSATLQVDAHDCGSLSLALTQKYETTSSTSTTPMFRHLVDCK